ncbi:LacI family DNA-binding transcriptional regulator [Aliidongia dinghuensis]|uniref:LacI family DNA-binding transcriptional regulator n=1 Tax=Aliidongia dinghuensis TaxID=1867774 RepID=UPI001662EEA1|nr:LacI family DNA-binding transcriptional regulator [Aliidongia dinghuensis]
MTERAGDTAGKAATIRDVAACAGTSIATVSYVLNNKSRYLRPELRERVLAAAQELGYVKNAAARSLKGLQRGILAVLVPQFGNNFFTRMCVEIEAVAQRAGFVVTICNSDENPVQERAIIERLLSQRIDGCILSPALSRTESAALLERARVPYVILERTMGTAVPDHDFVGHDNFQSGYIAAQALLDAGHRRIAFLGWDSPIANINDREQGYRAALAEAGVAIEPGWVLTGSLSEDEGRRLADRLPVGQVTAAVLATHHTMAKGVLMSLQDRGLRWPQDLSLVLIGTPEWVDLVRPGLACVERPEREMGHAAAALLLEKLKRPDYRQAKLVLPTRFIPGGSIRPIKIPETSGANA